MSTTPPILEGPRALPKFVTARKFAEAEQTADDQVTLTLPSKDFILAQVSIVSSVMCEPESHFIKPATAKFVNANGDCWTNESLRSNYESFIGAYNFVNHVQDPERAVGFCADAALRRKILDEEDNIYVYYVDLLVATHRDSHPSLVRKILANSIEYLSMGCESFESTCSACGHKATDETEFCDHLDSQKGKFFVDKSGQRRIVAEMLGNSKAGTVDFHEASWLTEPPAFGGAIKRGILQIPEGKSVQVQIPKKAAAKPAVQKYVDRKR
jgi:hypothetical protein